MYRRRKWLILFVSLLVPAEAVALSLRQEQLFEASADVLLSRQNESLAASVSGIPDSTRQDEERFSQTQIQLGRLPVVAARVLDAAELDSRTAEEFLGSSGISAKENADLLEFRVTDPHKGVAVRLATEYAEQFTKYRRELDTAALGRALATVERQIDEQEKQLGAKALESSPEYASLLDKQQRLETLADLQGANAQVVREAKNAKKVQPKPIRNGALGFALGFVLAVGLAFLRDALDTRVRSAEEIAERLHLPLLVRLERPPRRLRNDDRLVMLAEPTGSRAEAFHMLRTNLEFVNLDRGARTIMVSSAIATEGKSTTVANLAVAFARAGRHVVLVDLDLRRPLIDRFFELEGRPGVTNVLLGQAGLEEALCSIALTGAADEKPSAAKPEKILGVTAVPPESGGKSSTSAFDELRAIRTEEKANGFSFGRNGRGASRLEGVLEVLPSGPTPPTAGELLSHAKISALLEALGKRADLVLVDAPPLLHVGDAMTLSGLVDALVVVTRLKVLRRGTLAELHRLLEAAPASKLGFVAAGAKSEEGYADEYVYAYADARTGVGEKTAV